MTPASKSPAGGSRLVRPISYREDGHSGGWPGRLQKLDRRAGAGGDALWRNGFNVLLIDLRDTGDSTFQDGRSTIGNEEYRDVLGAWDWLVKEKGIDSKRIGLFANSLGGANANYAFSVEPRIAALFLQSTFGNLQQIIAAELARNGYPTFLAPAAVAMGNAAITGQLIGPALARARGRARRDPRSGAATTVPERRCAG